MAKEVKDEKKLSWTTVDVETLPKALDDMYERYKSKQKEASEAREKFDAAFKEKILAETTSQPGKELLVSHRFDKLTFAWGEPRAASGGTFKFGAK